MSPGTHATVTRTERLSFWHTLSSEWIKLWTIRSTFWTLAVTVVVGIGISALVAWGISSSANDPNLPPEAVFPGDAASLTVTAATAGLSFAQLAIAVLGVLIISGEYSTGMIRSSLVAVPSRLPVLAAKAVVLTVVTFITGLLIVGASYLLTQPLLASMDGEVPITDPDVGGYLIGAAGYLTFVALLSLGIGTIVRSSAAGIAIAVGLLLVAPIVFSLIPFDWSGEVARYLPSAVGSQLYSAPVDPELDPDALELWQAILVIVGWLAVTLGLGAWLLKRRDA